MSTFQFTTVPAVLVEYGSARRLGEVLRERYPGLERLCVVTDRFLHQGGLLDPALDGLRRHGWSVTVIDDVVADPPEQVVLETTERARASGVQILLGLGAMLVGQAFANAPVAAVLQSEESFMFRMDCRMRSCCRTSCALTGPRRCTGMGGSRPSWRRMRMAPTRRRCMH